MKVSALFLAFALAGCATAPPPDAPLRDGVATARLGGHARFAGLDVQPLGLEEDSRCPTLVRCVQAGTVRLKTRIEDRKGRRDVVLSLRDPLPLASGGWLDLALVCPHRHEPGKIAPAAYLFTFAFRVDGPPPPTDRSCA